MEPPFLSDLTTDEVNKSHIEKPDFFYVYLATFKQWKDLSMCHEAASIMSGSETRDRFIVGKLKSHSVMFCNILKAYKPEG